MRLDEEQESQNVEDRRGFRVSKGVAGGGIGSFTTFSTWILDSHRLADAGHIHLVWLNLGLSLVAGFAAVAVGHWLGGAV